MPFTLAHPAAVLPFRNKAHHLPMATLVAGSMAPDFEYLARLRPFGTLLHSPLGAIFLSVPLAILMGWYAEKAFLPDLRKRLHLSPQIGSPFNLMAAVLAAGVGVLTHLLWDSFTHPGGVMVKSLGFLSAQVVAGIPVFKLLQHGSTVVGFSALAAILGPRAFSLDRAGRNALLSLLFAGGLVGLASGATNAIRATSLHGALGYFAVGFLIGILVVALTLPILSACRRQAT